MVSHDWHEELTLSRTPTIHSLFFSFVFLFYAVLHSGGKGGVLGFWGGAIMSWCSFRYGLVRYIVWFASFSSCGRMGMGIPLEKAVFRKAFSG